MKIYVVTSGSYSDYCIKKIFTNKDKAEHFSRWCYDSQVEEYETSDEDAITPVYQVHFAFELSDNKHPYINIRKGIKDSPLSYHYTLFNGYGISGHRCISASNYKGDDYTKEKCDETFENFLMLHNKEVARLKGNKNLSSIAI